VSFEAKERPKEMKMLHEQVRAHIENVNEQYKAKTNKNRAYIEFELGDLVWLHLRKESIPSIRKSKLMPGRDGPYKLVQRVGDNG